MRYKIEMSRSATRSTSIEVEGISRDDVMDKAYEMARGTDFNQGTEWDDVNYCIEEMDLIDDGRKETAGWFFSQLERCDAIRVFDKVEVPVACIGGATGNQYFKIGCQDFCMDDICEVIVYENGNITFSDIHNITCEPIEFLKFERMT